jgi:voltage-gated potassium channel
MPDRFDRVFGLAATSPRARGRNELVLFVRRLAQLGLVIVLLVAAGTVGFAVTEGISAWAAFVLTLDTVATVGSIPSPHGLGGQVVKVVLIILGVGTLFYALVTVTEFFVAGHLAELLAERRMQRTIDSLSDHYLICGFGRVGQRVARRLEEAGEPFVVIDANPDVRDEMEDEGVLHVGGQASDDEVLCEAGIERARAVVACVDSDAENIFVTITARALLPDIEIVARAADEATERKLIRAGANDVISPYKASGDAMARLALGVPGERERGIPVDIDEDGRPEGRIAAIDPADTTSANG